ncbi:MAG: DNA internalization-related competence protein ComEC/Rec2 [Ignavibacteria bacterium]|nr:DNA internalization-related competence protein ComEC/Rec2 [Ignavibacteria bacterium]
MTGRPVPYITTFFIIGIICAQISRSVAFIIISSLILLFIICFTIIKKRNELLFIIILSVMFYSFGGIYAILRYNSIITRYQDYLSNESIITGFIYEEPEIKDTLAKYVIRTSTVNYKKINGNILLYLNISGGYESKDIFSYGNEVIIKGKIEVWSKPDNPGSPDFAQQNARKGISAYIKASTVNIQKTGNYKGAFLKKAGYSVRDSIVSVIRKSLPPQQAELLNAMLIGYKDGLDDNVREAFSKSGLSHIMAVSGANIAFLMLPLLFLFKKLPIDRRIVYGIIIILLFFFLFITGIEASVTRAVVMASVILAGKIIRRDGEVFTTIFLSGFILLIVNPMILFDIGFQLSYAATLSLILFYPGLKVLIKGKYIPSFVSEVISATLAAQIGVIPITIVYFNTFSAVSLIANIMAVPVLELITIIGMLMAFAGQIWPFISVIAGYANSTLVSYILFIAGKTAQMPGASTQIGTPAIFQVLLYYMLVIFTFTSIKGKKQLKHSTITILSFAALFLILLPARFNDTSLKIIVFSAGEGDAILIRTETGRTIVIDGGEPGKSPLIQYLLDYGTKEIDMIITTHPHDDHMKELIPLFSAFKVKSLAFAGGIPEDLFGEIIGEAKKTKVSNIQSIKRGDRIIIGKDSNIDVIWPESEIVEGFSKYKSDNTALNNCSLVLKLNYGNFSMLFTGDAGEKTEEKLLDMKEDLQADVLKVGHHGSSGSSGTAFLSAISPDVAVISVGRNYFGHPAIKAVIRIEQTGATIYRTDLNGAVIITSDGERCTIKTMK